MYRTTLPNGLRLVVLSRPVGLAALYLWIDAGSTDERPGEHGAAHFLEHMLFKGTARRGVGEAASAIEALGGDLNAYTTHDNTVLHASVLAEGAEVAMDVLADMARHSSLDPKELALERDVVIEEIRGYDAMAEEQLHEAMGAAAYPGDPYGRPIAGTIDEVKGLTPEDLRTFWRREWGADRAILSVVGEVDPERVLECCTRLFGDWAPAAARRFPQTASRVPETQQIVVDPKKRRTRLIQFAWPTVAATHPDAPALDLIALILFDGPGALIPERLGDEALMAEPWGGAGHRQRGGTVNFGFVPRKDRSRAAIARTLAVLAEIVAEGLPSDVVERAKAGMVSDFVFASETVDGMAHELALHWAWYGDPTARDGQRERYAGVTTHDLDRALRTYLTPERAIVGCHDKTLDARALSQSIRVGLEHTPPKPWRALDLTLENGVRLRVRPEEGQGEVVAITICILGGMLAVKPAHAGIAEAWASLVTAGADGMSAGRYSSCVDATGGVVWGASGRATLEIHGRFPRDTAAEGLALTLMTLSDPEWDPDVWERQRDELLHGLDSLLEDPTTVANHAMWKALFPDHPWALAPEGSRTTLKRLRPALIAELHDRLVLGSRVVVSVAGPLPSGRVAHLVREWLSPLPKSGRAFVPPKPGPHPPAQRLRRTALSEQAYVGVGVRGHPLGHPEQAAAQVLITWLSAQSGPLFLELREKLGLAYSVGADSVSSLGAGLVHVGLATDPARLSEARRALHRLLDRLMDTPPSDDELRRTVRSLHGARASAAQQAGRRASRLARITALGVEQAVDQLPAAWDRVTPSDVQTIAAKFFGQPRTTVEVRPRA
ncbi:MAG: insulinase family protein [Deltaproteobacteria bacterium]|nr:MAG: insulinase family protein [Deltaproteobacteria bacterium]